MEGKINKQFKKLCCVPFCSDKTSAQHRFPKREPEVFGSWLRNINNLKLHGMPSEQIYQNFRVCDRHFSDDCKVPGKRGLKRKAVPTLFIPANEETLESIATDEIIHTEADPAKKCKTVDITAIFGESSTSESFPVVAEGISEDAMKQFMKGHLRDNWSNHPKESEGKTTTACQSSLSCWNMKIFGQCSGGTVCFNKIQLYEHRLLISLEVEQ